MCSTRHATINYTLAALLFQHPYTLLLLRHQVEVLLEHVRLRQAKTLRRAALQVGKLNMRIKPYTSSRCDDDDIQHAMYMILCFVARLPLHFLEYQQQALEYKEKKVRFLKEFIEVDDGGRKEKRQPRPAPAASASDDLLKV